MPSTRALCAALLVAWTAAAVGATPKPEAVLDEAAEPREPVVMPAAMRQTFRATMRDHLRAMQEVGELLAAGRYDRARRVAEDRLGMTGMLEHEGGRLAVHLPDAMQVMGQEMHRSGSRLAIQIQNASVDGDLAEVLGAFAEVAGECVACHERYRLSESAPAPPARP